MQINKYIYIIIYIYIYIYKYIYIPICACSAPIVFSVLQYLFVGKFIEFHYKTSFYTLALATTESIESVINIKVKCFSIAKIHNLYTFKD